MEEIIFPLSLKIRLDWSEMDLFGHVNNVMFFKYIQSARVNYWEKIGFEKLTAEKNIGLILASASCKYIKRLHYPGDITIQSRMNFIKNTSFGITHRILNDKNEIAAEAEDVLVVFDYNKNEKTLFPDVIRAEVEIMEGRRF